MAGANKDPKNESFRAEKIVKMLAGLPKRRKDLNAGSQFWKSVYPYVLSSYRYWSATSLWHRRRSSPLHPPVRSRMSCQRPVATAIGPWNYSFVETHHLQSIAFALWSAIAVYKTPFFNAWTLHYKSYLCMFRSFSRGARVRAKHLLCWSREAADSVLDLWAVPLGPCSAGRHVHACHSGLLFAVSKKLCPITARPLPNQRT